MSLSSRVSKERIRKGITQEELASLANVTVRTIQRIESGDSIPRMFTVKAIATALEIPYESLAQDVSSIQLSGFKPDEKTAIDPEADQHFLQFFCLSCFSFLVIPYIHFLIPSWYLKKSATQSIPVKTFARKVIRQQTIWVIAFHLLLLLTLVYNFIISEYGSRQYLLSYLMIVLVMYFLNVMLIIVNLVKSKKVSSFVTG
jgi:XRE family transcriptional regulator, regulator of sulfur utilization